MKCPHCGQWNIASLPRCFKCGEPLPTRPEYLDGPDWQRELKEEAPKVYVRADESGRTEAVPDQRETLAREMAELKARKFRGEKQQRKLREESSRRGMAPSSMTVRTNTTRATVFRLKDDPETALRPIPPELVEEGEVEDGAKHAYTARFTRSAEEERNEEGFFPGTQTTSQWVPPSGRAASSQPVYDGFNDSSAYEPLWDEAPAREASQPKAYTFRRAAPRRTRRQKFFTFALSLLLLCVAVLAVKTGIALWQRELARRTPEEKPSVVASIVDDQAAHTITIPGKDGTQIYVKELSNTYTISGGKAVLEVPDYIWYSNYEDLLSDTMDVTVTPFTRSSAGKLTPMDPITYQIQIPLSPIELITPDTNWVEVATAMYPMKFRVREDSRVTINGSDYSDLVNQEGGEVTYNATVQPIGDNKVVIKVRSQYCRENVVEITLFRAKQEVPLDLVSDQTYSSSKKSMKITATTIPGADVEVLTPNTDLDITNIAVDGTFSFYAVFSQIGNNLVTIQASMSGRQPSVLSFNVYYVPPADEYTKVAWGLDSSNASGKANYADLLTNNALRVKNTQIYVMTGVITQIISSKPQLAILNAGTEESPQNVMLENSTKTTWVEGQKYQIFADAYGMYVDMPRLIARYTYKK